MLRTAVKPKWLMLLVVAALVALAFVQLGRWQLGRAHEQARAEALAEAARQPVVPVAELLTPHTEFPSAAGGRLVTATGTYGAGQVLVPGRLLEGRKGYWVLTPLRTHTATLAVVRGFTTEPIAPAPPAGTLTATVSLAPGESPAAEPSRDGRLGSVDLARLVNTWPGALYNAFGFAQREVAGTSAQAANTPPANTPLANAPADDPGPLTRIPPPRPDTSLNARNVGYALQWWVFAGFAFFLWLRMVQADNTTGPGSARRAASRAKATPTTTTRTAATTPSGSVAPAESTTGSTAAPAEQSAGETRHTPLEQEI